MASLDNHHKVNGARLSQLLIDKGTEAMRNVFDGIYTPSTLTAVLTSKKSFLQKLRCINRSQLEILFPSSGTPVTSKDFDITLLFILLRNICGLHPPTSTGYWDKNPPFIDQSIEANLVRIKYYRNVVYGHITRTGIDDVNFQLHWNNISATLISLGISPGDIEALLCAPLEEDVYLNLIRNWKEKEDKLESVMLNRFDKVESVVQKRLDKLEEAVVKSQKEVQNTVERINEKVSSNQQNELAKCNFKGDINKLNKAYHEGSRKWLLDYVDDWFTDHESDSRVMILTAGPGVGKSVFAAKVCQVYQEKGLLAASHFCKFNYTDLRNPKTMLESLSSHMCDSVAGFKEKLAEQLRRHHSRDTITDAFRVLLNDPLHALDEQQPMMIVIDGLDESETGGKSELLDVISKEFPHLPECVKIFITSRPELSVREKLDHLNPFEIKPGNKSNDQDLNDFIGNHLAEFNMEEDVVKDLVKKCQGSFLFAHHLVLSLARQRKNESSNVGDVKDCIPKSIGSVYKEYFDRLWKELESLFPETTEKFDVILEILTAAQGPLPLSLVAEVLDLPEDTRSMREVIQKVNERLSALLLVYDDCLTVFHKSVVDWLLSKGYNSHPYSVDQTFGHRHLWLACQGKLRQNQVEQRQKKAKEYAKRNGISHLQMLSMPKIASFSIGLTFNSISDLPGVFDSVGVLSARFPGCPTDGCTGWIFHQENENAYVMTTNRFVDIIQTRFKRSEQIVQMKFRSDTYDAEIYVADLNDSVAVRCDEESVLDYAVIKFRVRSEGSSRKRFTIAKQCPPPGSTLHAFENIVIQTAHVLPYPNYLIDFWQSFSPTTSYEQKSLGRVELNKDKFLFNNLDRKKSRHGDPLVNAVREVVGMQTSFVYINSSTALTCSTFPTGTHMISIAVRIDKIIEDIYRNNPVVALKLFPDFYQ